MKKMTLLLTAAVAALLALPSAYAEKLSCHNVFQNNMCLQRRAPIKISGKADPGKTVTVTIEGSQAKPATAKAVKTAKAAEPKTPTEPKKTNARPAEPSQPKEAKAAAKSMAPLASRRDLTPEPPTWKAALAAYRKEHPKMNPDDLIVACARKWPRLYATTKKHLDGNRK